MNLKINKKLKFVLSISLLSILIINFMVPYVNAAADIIDPDKVLQYTNVEANDKVLKTANIVIGTIQVIGTVISVAVITLLGVKYIMGSVEERADYKKAFVPYIVGVIFIFATTTVIVPLIYNMVNS